MIKLIYLDVETTGVDHIKNGIHQISGIVEVDYEVKETFNFKVQPRPGCQIDQDALDLGKVTADQINSYPPQKEVFKQFKAVLDKHINSYDKLDKAFFVGYNSHFDCNFLRQFFTDNDNKFFGSYFWAGTIDVMSLALNHLKLVRNRMKNFKLPTVAEKFGIKVEESLHDASYDIKVTRQIYHMLEKDTIRQFEKLKKGESFFEILKNV